MALIYICQRLVVVHRVTVIYECIDRQCKWAIDTEVSHHLLCMNVDRDR